MGSCQAGDRINNYLLQECVGTGSFGQVWKARHHIFDQLVAIKVPTDPQYVRNLQHEGVAIHGLKHANIVRALDLDPYADPPYLIMEFVDGPSLRRVIDQHPGGMPQSAALSVFRGLLTALSLAHRAGLVHRDIKPANILLNIAGRDVSTIEPTDVKVTDFGLGTVGGLTTASIMQSGSLTTEEGKSISGTLAYMSPEQRDGKTVDPRSDLYACGIVLFEMLTGVLPQGTDLPSQVRAGLPRSIDSVFQRCYTRLENRFASADEILAGLGAAGIRPVESASPIPRFGRSSRESLCRNCGNRVSKDDQFCITCGNQLVEQVFRCPLCSAFVHQADNFCITCGTTLRKVSSGV